MKNHFINVSDISEAFIREPQESEKYLPFITTHGWQVVIIMRSRHQGEAPLTIEKESEQAYIDFISQLGLFQIR